MIFTGVNCKALKGQVRRTYHPFEKELFQTPVALSDDVLSGLLIASPLEVLHRPENMMLLTLAKGKTAAEGLSSCGDGVAISSATQSAARLDFNVL